jgi:hypothetical protein
VSGTTLWLCALELQQGPVLGGIPLEEASSQYEDAALPDASDSGIYSYYTHIVMSAYEGVIMKE